MKTLLFALVASSVLPAEPLKIEDWSFVWRIAESGQARISVHKEVDSTRLWLETNNEFQMFKPEDAKAVGDVLAQADKYYAKLKGSKDDARETVETGDHRVVFWNSPKYGFKITVGEKDAILGGSVMLDRKQCAALAPHLKRGPELCEHVDKVLDEAIEP